MTGPLALTEMIDRVRHLVVDMVEDEDRGSTVLRWPGDGTQPPELSLEHELRLAPDINADIGHLVTALHTSEGAAASDSVLPRFDPSQDWYVHRRERPSGPQSEDRYYDHDDLRLTKAGLTVRMRLKSLPGMRWRLPPDGAAFPLNAEVGAEIVDAATGLVRRCELNWFGDLATELARSSDRCSPVSVMEELTGRKLGGIRPVSRHRTVRDKFILGPPEQPRLAVNIDYVSAWNELSGKDHRVSWVDVDVASLRRVDAAEQSLLVAVGQCLIDAHSLRPLPITKAARGRQRFDTELGCDPGDPAGKPSG